MSVIQRIQLRRDTSGNWTTNDPILAQGEIGVETDTRLFKIGDGVTAWVGLSYANLAGNSLANTQIAFGKSTNTIGGDANFTYNVTTKTVRVNKIQLNDVPLLVTPIIGTLELSGGLLYFTDVSGVQKLVSLT